MSESSDQLKTTVESLNAAVEQLGIGDLDGEQALELIRQCAVLAADASKQLEQLTQSVDGESSRIP